MKHLNTLAALAIIGAGELRFQSRNFHKLPATSGLYFVCKGFRILYVGKTNDFRVRWHIKETGECNHHNYAELRRRKAGRIIFIKLPNFLTHGGEAMLIDYLDPIQNGRREPFRLIGWLWALMFLSVPTLSVSLISILVIKYGGPR